jgi:hypothetical protein
MHPATFFPFTAGDMQGSPERVSAPQRGLDSIGPVLRGRSPVIYLTCAALESGHAPCDRAGHGPGSSV